MSQTTEKAPIPPYVSYRTLRNFVDGIRKTLPPVIDKSVMRTLNGSVQVQLMSALRYLGFIDNDGRTQEALKNWAKKEGEERAAELRAILEQAYPFLFSDEDNFDLATGTTGQFDNKFRASGASGDTIRKCQRFFLDAAKDAGIEVSSHILPNQDGRNEKSSSPRERRPKPSKRIPKGDNKEREEKPPSMSYDQLLLDRLLAKFPDFNPAWSEQEKIQWHENFRELMKMVRESTMDSPEVQYTKSPPTDGTKQPEP